MKFATASPKSISYHFQKIRTASLNKKPQSSPDGLNTTKARKLIDKAVEAGFITVEAGRYKWNGTKVLLSYFAVKATAYLRLRTKDKATASWKPFEILFQVKALRQSKADFEKWNPDLTPTGADKIDALFE